MEATKHMHARGNIWWNARVKEREGEKTDVLHFSLQ